MVLAMSGAMKFEPESVTIHLKADAGANRVCWVATGLLAGYTVHLEGDATVFPKLRAGLSHEQPYANSGPPAQAGTWQYQATLLRPDAEPVVVSGLTVIVQP
jgi:hypothetical protein